MPASLRRASRRVQPDSPAAFHAPLFHELVSGLDADERYVVLDLGTASTATLALLGQCRCRAEIVDLAYFGGLDELNRAEPGAALTSTADALLPQPPQNEAFDLVLCWDLPNYLNLDALTALMAAVRDRARPGALAHALIFYAQRDMQEQPGRFVPTADGELSDTSTAGRTVAAPRYSPEALDKSMGRFGIDRARLLSNGMQEFLFQLG